MKKDIKLYNMILPTFMLFAFYPLMWIFSLVGNFIIDSIVLLLITVAIFKKLDFATYRKNILLIWILGFTADFIGALYLFTLYGLLRGHNEAIDTIWQNIQSGVHQAFNLQLYNFWGFIYMFSGILLAAILIFVFDYAVFKIRTDFTKKQRVLAALSFALLTAPYTYFLPSESFDWYFRLMTPFL